MSRTSWLASLRALVLGRARSGAHQPNRCPSTLCSRPAVETLEKLARALEVPMYELLYEGEEPPKPQMTGGKAGQKLWGASGKDARYLRKLQQCLSRMNEEDRNLLLFTVAKMSRSKRREKVQ